jgi:hypothetical protein
MRAIFYIREKKILSAPIVWHSGKRMPRTAFPLSKAHSYPLGSSFDWCVCEAQSDQAKYKILVGFDAAKEQYRAWLGMAFGTDQALLARLEFHPTHNGWHCHRKLGPAKDVVRGVVKEPRSRDREKICKVVHKFEVTQLNALNIAFRVFNVGNDPQAKEGDLFQ